MLGDNLTKGMMISHIKVNDCAVTHFVTPLLKAYIDQIPTLHAGHPKSSSIFQNAFFNFPECLSKLGTIFQNKKSMKLLTGLKESPSGSNISKDFPLNS